MLEGNKEAIEAWNTVLFDKFVEFRHVLTTGLGAHGTRALELFPVREGNRVVDIGCGFGDTTVDLARRVGPKGHAHGLDAAARFIESARANAKGVENASFEVCDIEEHVTGGPYDHAFSRMGTMFFASPVFALRNIRKALVPGAKLCMVVWRKKDANDWLHAAELVARDILGDPPKGDQVTCGPGPFSMASADLTSDQTKAAGFRDITFTRSDVEIEIGRDLAEAVRFALMLGPAGEIVRLAGDAGVKRRPEIEAAIGKVLEPWVKSTGVIAPSSCWIVTATS
ncbi:MAG: methyltransferase domain-containing protein [Kofleriaceae bacterium]